MLQGALVRLTGWWLTRACALVWQLVMASRETWKYLVMCVLTVNLKQIFRHVDATMPKFLIRCVPGVASHGCPRSRMQNSAHQLCACPAATVLGGKANWGQLRRVWCSRLFLPGPRSYSGSPAD